MKTVFVPPYAPTLIESTRAIGYTLESAIADIVDNSVSAFASCTEIFFFPIGNSYIAILDNGYGMNAEELENAMRYGSQNPNDKRAVTDLGRFGLGLKTASLSQCRSLTVASKKNGVIEVRCWDIDHVIETGEWSLIALETVAEMEEVPCIAELSALENGTLVVWQKLDRLKIGELNFDRSMGRKMDEVRNHLSLVFHRYLSGESGLQKLQIIMNGVPINAADPFLMRRNTQVMADEELFIEGAKVMVRPYILPHISKLSAVEIAELGGKEGLRKSQGFYVYRNKRLLIWGTWFRMMRQGELSKLARIQVDIPNDLDNLWTIDIKKSMAVPPEVVKNNLASVIQRMAEHSKQTWTFRGKKETNDSVIHVWQRFKGVNEGFFYKINREHPLVQEIMDENLQVKRNVEALLKTVESRLPLNQLYIDLTSEKVNEPEVLETDVENMLKALLEAMHSSAGKQELLDRLLMTDPFMNYPQVIDKYRKAVARNGCN